MAKTITTVKALTDSKGKYILDEDEKIRIPEGSDIKSFIIEYLKKKKTKKKPKKKATKKKSIKKKPKKPKTIEIFGKRPKEQKKFTIKLEDDRRYIPGQPNKPKRALFDYEIQEAEDAKRIEMNKLNNLRRQLGLPTILDRKDERVSSEERKEKPIESGMTIQSGILRKKGTHVFDNQQQIVPVEAPKREFPKSEGHHLSLTPSGYMPSRVPRKLEFRQSMMDIQRQDQEDVQDILKSVVDKVEAKSDKDYLDSLVEVDPQNIPVSSISQSALRIARPTQEEYKVTEMEDENEANMQQQNNGYQSWAQLPAQPQHLEIVISDIQRENAQKREHKREMVLGLRKEQRERHIKGEKNKQKDEELLNREQELLNMEGSGTKHFKGIWSSDIEKVLKHVPEFQDVIASDQIYKIDFNRKGPISFIMNKDVSTGPGYHWVGFYMGSDHKKLYYYDPLSNPIQDTVMKELQHKIRHPVELVENGNRQQRINSNDCGFYAVNFILDMSHGKSFEESTKNSISKSENLIKSERDRYVSGVSKWI